MLNAGNAITNILFPVKPQWDRVALRAPDGYRQLACKPKSHL
jgi:hypothetical protein